MKRYLAALLLVLTLSGQPADEACDERDIESPCFVPETCDECTSDAECEALCDEED